MCTLAVLWKCHPAAPLVIAQCRDEVLARPAVGVVRWRTARGAEVVSGKDVVAGGTWFGVGPRVVCGLTNRRDALGPRRGELSRGELVVDALEKADVGEVERELATRHGPSYGPFSLLACDDDRMIYAENVDDQLRIETVAPGVHVLGNRSLDNAQDPVVQRVKPAAEALLDVDEAALVLALQQLLGRHGEGWPCVHLEIPGLGAYGTRSAGVLLQRALDPRFLTHDGAPHDVAGWRDSSGMLTPPLAR